MTDKLTPELIEKLCLLLADRLEKTTDASAAAQYSAAIQNLVLTSSILKRGMQKPSDQNYEQ